MTINSDPTYNKHQGNAASNEAYAVSVAHHEADRERIYRFIAAHVYGVTSKEIGEWIGKPLHKFSGRLTQLKADGLIRVTDERRHGAQVLVSVQKQGRMF